MPAAYSQYGDPSYVFGFNDATISALAASIGIRATEAKLSFEPEFSAQAENEDGVIASRVIGPDKITCSISGFLVDETAFKNGNNFTLVINGESRFFVKDSKSLGKMNKDFQKAEFTATSNKLVTS